MEQGNKFNIHWSNLAYIFGFFLILSLFFPVRYIFPTKEAYITGVFSDFTAFSLYLSDILLVIVAIFTIFAHKKAQFSHLKVLFPLVLWIIVTSLCHYKSFSWLNTYFIAKFLEMLVAYGTFSVLLSKTSIKLAFFKTFGFFSTFEALLGFSQFYKNGPLNLGLLGEQQIYPLQKGIAKLTIGQVLQVRSYGTFPHPNVFSAFLVVAVLILAYLFQNSQKTWQKLVYGLALIINVFGLVTTFSRAALLALSIGLLVYFGAQIFKKMLGNRGVQALVIILSSFIACFFIFKPYLLARTNLSGESTINRVIYAKAGLKIIQDHPIAGIGIGESLLHMKQYSQDIRWPWQIQPIHNYFLLAAAELGLVGVGIIAWFFFWHFKLLWQKLKEKKTKAGTTYFLFLVSCLLSFLILMQFDHYFYTLQQTQLLLWITLGLIATDGFTEIRNVLK